MPNQPPVNPFTDQEFMNLLGASMIGSIQPGMPRGGNFAAPAMNAWMKSRDLANQQAWRQRQAESEQAHRQTLQERWEHERSVKDPYIRSQTARNSAGSQPRGLSTKDRAKLTLDAIKQADEYCADKALFGEECTSEERTAKVEELKTQMFSRGGTPSGSGRPQPIPLDKHPNPDALKAREAKEPGFIAKHYGKEAADSFLAGAPVTEKTEPVVAGEESSIPDVIGGIGDFIGKLTASGVEAATGEKPPLEFDTSQLLYRQKLALLAKLDPEKLKEIIAADVSNRQERPGGGDRSQKIDALLKSYDPELVKSYALSILGKRL